MENPGKLSVKINIPKGFNADGTAFAAVEVIISRAAVEEIDACSSVRNVVVPIHIMNIVVAATKKAVVSAPAKSGIVAAATRQSVVAGGARHAIVLVSAAALADVSRTLIEGRLGAHAKGTGLKNPAHVSFPPMPFS
jgi:hypothetical protein